MGGGRNAYFSLHNSDGESHEAQANVEETFELLSCSPGREMSCTCCQAPHLLFMFTLSAIPGDGSIRGWFAWLPFSLHLPLYAKIGG